MLYSQSCEYAIRALSYIALQPEGKFSTTREIAEHQGIPRYFLGKLLQMLAKRGLVKSARGKGGGWALEGKATGISLLKIVECTDGLVNLERCFFALGVCSREEPCPLRQKCQLIIKQIMALLETETLAELAAPMTKALERIEQE